MERSAGEPVRICSLLPGATEVVAALGRADCLVGISHECDWPTSIRDRPIVVRPRFQSGLLSSRELDRQVSAAVAAGRRLYELDAAAVHAGDPTVVLTQDLCDVCAVTPDQLQQALAGLSSSPRVLSLHPTRLHDVIGDIAKIAVAIGRPTEGQQLADALQRELGQIRSQLQSLASAAPANPRVACVEWLDPPYIGGHWVPDMVACAGAVDALGEAGMPSRRTSWQDIADADPDLIVLMPCGYSVAQTRAEMTSLPPPPGWKDLAAVRNGRVYAVDAAAHFSRPGPRLIHGVRVLAALCHPTLGWPLSPEEAMPVAFGAISSGISPAPVNE